MLVLGRKSTGVGINPTVVARAMEQHMMKKSLDRSALTLTAMAALASNAEAHTGFGAAHDILSGLVHPLTGPDHIAAMIAVGILAARLGGRALWLVPGTFLLMMAVGGVAAILGLQVPMIEIGIMASVLVLGMAAVLRINISVSLAAGLAGFFAVFHGVAHAVEMPVDASGITYATGFICATALLHATGIAAARIATKVRQRQFRLSPAP
jgi:urease accessory protein